MPVYLIIKYFHMQTNVLDVSENFRKMAIKSILSIVLFLFTYLALIVLAIGIVLLCGLIAYTIVMLKAIFITVMVGLGFLGMGFLIFFFLIKFMFSGSVKVDRSHLLEITQAEQPELFKLIHEIVNEVKTDFPKKVYLSSDVNASVFYDSSFWSMFFPIKKNLQIGLGLMNSVSAIELKAILAHEFGHFSQRSMKVGSYAYHVNRVIYNMLYDNDSYSELLNRWSGISSYFSLFSSAAIWVVGRIQKILYLVYNRLNLNYMALSREMEFHADAVAASVAGSQPLAGSLLRLGLADQSLSVVFAYYDSKIEAAQKTSNFYPQQSFVMNRLAASENLSFSNGLPSLSVDGYKRFNKTKLVLDDQWSSHPSTEERVARLIALNQPEKDGYEGIAMDLLSNKEQLQEMFTERLFASVSYTAEPTMVAAADFIKEYTQKEQEHSYPAVYNGYFDVRDPFKEFTEVDFEAAGTLQTKSFKNLFNDEIFGVVRSLETASSDLQTLERINRKELEITTFDYDGEKYTADSADRLIRQIEADIARSSEQLAQHETEIFRFFLNRAALADKLSEFRQCALNYQAVAKEVKTRSGAYLELVNATSFMQVTTPFETINENMYQVKRLEKPFKEQISILLADAFYKNLIDEKQSAGFEEYLANDWKYFAHNMYFDKEVDALFAVINDFSLLVFHGHFKAKKALLEFQVDLIESEALKADQY